MKLSKKKGEKNRIGARGEKYAARWLFLHGYRIVGRNVEMKRGELDIVAKRGKYIVFFEVKTRSDFPNETYGRPAYAVNYEKRRHIIGAAEEYLRAHPTDKIPRIDIIEVYLDPEHRRRHRVVQIKSAIIKA